MLKHCLILNLRDFGENSLIVIVLHPQLGKQEYLAKGAKNIGAKLTPWLQPLCFVELELTPSKRELPTIREVQLVKNYLPSGYLPSRLSLRISSFLDMATYPQLECTEFMGKILALLEILTNSSISLKDLRRCWVQFELLLLHYLGVIPDLGTLPRGDINRIARYLERKIHQALRP